MDFWFGRSVCFFLFNMFFCFEEEQQKTYTVSLMFSNFHPEKLGKMNSPLRPKKGGRWALINLDDHTSRFLHMSLMVKNYSSIFNILNSKRSLRLLLINMSSKNERAVTIPMTIKRTFLQLPTDSF